ncbi:hypothetical protein ILYODFUR_036719 [Ilyodon furcidens]|uniref:Uncharacterized protein n=1 Tax=Ilyodon furcidens TaxID=33524 RepID=A0ABV0UC68_9TELE
MIDDPTEGRISLHEHEFPCKIFSDSLSSCRSEHTAAQLEEARICVQPSVQDCPALESLDEIVSKTVCPIQKTSEPASDNNRVGSEVANYSLNETTSDADEVKFFSSDQQQPDDMRSSHTNLSSHGSIIDPDQTVSPSDKESFTVASPHSELHQIPGAASEEPPCQLSSKTRYRSAAESPINCARENPCFTSRGLSQPDTGITQAATAGVCGDGSQSSELQTSSTESETLNSNVRSQSGGSDFHKQVLEDKADLNPEAILTLKKTSAVKPLNDSECPTGSGQFKHQLETSPPKLKALGTQGVSIEQEEPQQKVFRSEIPVPSDTNVALKQFTEFQPITIMSSFLNLNKQLDVNNCPELSRISDRMQNAALHGLSGGAIQTVQHTTEKNSHLGSKSSPVSQEQPQSSITQRTFIELHLSPASGFISPVFKYNKEPTSKPTKDSKSKTYARLASKLSPLSRGVITNGMAKSEGLDSPDSTKITQFTTANDPKPSQGLLSGETLMVSTSRPNGQTMVKRSLSKDAVLSADYKPFSVQHKIKSFESLANSDKPVAKSSDVHTFAVAYTASLNQRIAGYMDLVNSGDWRDHQKNNSDYLKSGATLSPPLCESAEDEDLKASDGTTPRTPLVLRRKHGRLPTRKVHQLRALSMPDLEKLCTDDLSTTNNAAVNKNDSSICLTIAPKAKVTDCFSPTAMLSCSDDASSVDTPQRPPETRQPGWSIRRVTPSKLLHLELFNVSAHH